MTRTSIGRVEVTLANWRTYPHSRWSFQNACEIVPSAWISLAERIEQDGSGQVPLDEFAIEVAGGTSVPAPRLLAERYTDSFVALRDGRPVAEWHAPHADPEAPHLIFSVSKSITGLLAGIAHGDGLLDPEAPVTRYLPSMAGSTYGAATVRHLLDMTVDIDFDEDYLDHGGAFDRYRRAMLWNPERADTVPETMEAFLATMKAMGHGHGRRFHYASPNTDLLGLVIERATGQRFHEFLRERLWKPLGLAGPAYVTVDRVGTARAAGGICLTVYDLARIGRMVLDEGRSPEGQQLVPNTWIAEMRENGDRQAWIDGNFADMFANGRYRSCCYDVGDGRGTIAAVGIHGQYLWIDPTSRLVLARTASRPAASNDAETAQDIAMMTALARAL